MTTIAEKLTTINDALGDIKTAIEGKGVTPTGDITTYATAIGNISGGGSSGKYQLLDRVKDDSNNEIGTVSGFFTDANDVEYAVVCLDAQYRDYPLTFLSYDDGRTGLTRYTNEAIFSARETATFNTQKLLNYCSSYGYTSEACSHCRNLSFAIDGTSYSGQLPNSTEVLNIFIYRTKINSLDATASQPNAHIIPTNTETLTSNIGASGKCWKVTAYGFQPYGSESDGYVIPVLEIPLNDNV